MVKWAPPLANAIFAIFVMMQKNLLTRWTAETAKFTENAETAEIAETAKTAETVETAKLIS